MSIVVPPLPPRHEIAFNQAHTHYNLYALGTTYDPKKDIVYYAGYELGTEECPVSVFAWKNKDGERVHTWAHYGSFASMQEAVDVMVQLAWMHEADFTFLDKEE